MVKTLSTLLVMIKHLSLVLFFLTSFFSASTQDWKSYYDLAIAAYQTQHYPDAIVNAEKAYAASKSLDVKNQTYSLQLITAICLERRPASSLEMSLLDIQRLGSLTGASDGIQ